MNKMKNVIDIKTYELTASDAKKKIAAICENNERLKITTHTEQRMIERKITRTQILRCLINGRIIEGPYRDIRGNWKVTIESFSAGEPITVAAVIDRDSIGELILIVTAYI